jgi:lipopolysaccharide transport system permease protein
MQDENWDIVVKPNTGGFKINIGELWRYKDLISLMVKRDITSVYKQTILGPLWMLIQPAFTTAIYYFTFSVNAGISTDGLPPILFYLFGITFWNYFADCLNKTANTFISNASVFGKVYFPRMVMPISVVLSNLVKLAIQLALLLLIYIWYIFHSDSIQIHVYLLWLPVVCLLLIGLFSLSLGILFSAYTTKYRDLTFLLGFAVQLLMFASCVVFPVSMYSARVQDFLLFNPMVAYLEVMKYTLMGHGMLSAKHLIVDTLFVVLLFFVAFRKFSNTEKTFMDTV